MTVNIHLEFHHGGPVLSTQVEKTEELDFLFVSLFERPCVIGRLTDKVARHSIYLFTNFVVSSHTVVVERFQSRRRWKDTCVDVFLLNLSSLEEGGGACFGSDFYSNILTFVNTCISLNQLIYYEITTKLVI